MVIALCRALRVLLLSGLLGSEGKERLCLSELVCKGFGVPK